MLGFASAVLLGSEFRVAQDHILFFEFFILPQPGGPGPYMYIPRNGVVHLYPQTLGSIFIASCDYQG
jgi:hypothetical protein